MFLLAHISDLHIGPLPRPRLLDLCGKRIQGYLSWQVRRRRKYLPEILDALRTDLAAQQADHVAVTGDLVNLSLPAEFERAEAWLRALGPPEKVTVVPGNHDRYVPMPWSESLGLWSGYMSGDAGGRRLAGFDDFPQVRVRGDVAFVCLSSALPTRLFSAVGKIGPAQLAALESVLGELGGKRLYRVVLMHHGPLAAQVRRRRQLSDRRDFQAVISRVGAELILHGHHHHFSIGHIETAAGRAPVVGVPSASAGPRSAEMSCYHLYRIERRGDRWHTDSVSRKYDLATGHFVQGERLDLEEAG